MASVRLCTILTTGTCVAQVLEAHASGEERRHQLRNHGMTRPQHARNETRVSSFRPIC